MFGLTCDNVVSFDVVTADPESEVPAVFELDLRDSGKAIIAEHGVPSEFPAVVRDLRSAGRDVEVMFLEASVQVLENRYRETRRVHPLSPSGRPALPVTV